jgi:DNA-binding MarR family transcriptional regulator
MCQTIAAGPRGRGPLPTESMANALRKKNTIEEPPLGAVLEFLSELWAFEHAVQRTSKRMHSRLGITAEQRMVIRIIGRYPRILAGRLAEMLHLDAGTVSAALRRMEARRLLVRRKDPDDARRVVLELTARGRKLDVSTEGTIESAVAAALGSCRPAEIRSARAVLAKLIAALDADM